MKTIRNKTLLVVIIVFILTGCQSNTVEHKPSESKAITSEADMQEPIDSSFEQETQAETPTQIEEMDWESYFDGVKGAAVFYNPKQNHYQIYNQELAEERRSPCSTFKIISSLIGMKSGAIKIDDSVRTWSGELFWKEDWNQDIDFAQAFSASCVWYFREVTNEIGPDLIQKELNDLQYGNCDISDWKGEQNKNNNNPALRGFWIESSLQISPKEQTEVLARIFCETSEYTQNSKDYLKQVMLWTEEPQCEVAIYGKTGMGKVDGKTVDAWYVGLFTKAEEEIYFSVYLGESDVVEVSSKLAREIAQRIIDNL